MMLASFRRVARLGAAAALLAGVPLLAVASGNEPLPGEYRITAGRVDAGTFTGWRIFHSSCQACHGVGAVGTDLAPNLTERIKTYTPRGFATKVLTSYRIVPLAPDGSAEDRAAERAAMVEQLLKRERSERGQVVMPAWDGDNDVPPHVLDLYAYLSARADGAIGAGKPAMERPLQGQTRRR